MGRWFKSAVTVSIPAPVEQVWPVWADLEGMPGWIRWIDSVRMLEGDLSEWTMDLQGFQINWKAITTCVVEGERMHWESVDGLPFKGCVQFSPTPDGKTTAKVSIQYELPSLVAPLMDSGMLQDLVRHELTESLEGFMKLVAVRKA